MNSKAWPPKNQLVLYACVAVSCKPVGGALPTKRSSGLEPRRSYTEVFVSISRSSPLAAWFEPLSSACVPGMVRNESSEDQGTGMPTPVSGRALAAHAGARDSVAVPIQTLHPAQPFLGGLEALGGVGQAGRAGDGRAFGGRGGRFSRQPAGKLNAQTGEPRPAPSQ